MWNVHETSCENVQNEIKMNGFKKVVLFLKVILCLLAQWRSGNVIHGIVLKYDCLDKSKLCRFEELSIKLKRADLDFTFLSFCWTFNVILKFLAYNLPYTNDEDSRFIKIRLLQSATKKRRNERYRLEKQWQNIRNEVCAILSSIDKYIILHLIDRNVQKMVNQQLKRMKRNLRIWQKTQCYPLHKQPPYVIYQVLN